MYNKASNPWFGRAKQVRVTYFLMCDQGSLVSLCVQDYKSLCTPVTICATVVVPKCCLSILTNFDLEKQVKSQAAVAPLSDAPRCKFGDRRSVACRDNADISIFYGALKPSKVGQGVLVFGHQALFTSVFLCARFQFSESSGYDLSHHLMSQTDRPTDRRFLYRSYYVQLSWLVSQLS